MKRPDLGLRYALVVAALGVKCPTCPSCGARPGDVSSVTWPAQAWCDTEDCRVVVWNPEVTARENLVEAQVVDLDHLDRGPT